jgi:enediyne biosynthesis protein E4
MGMAAAAPRKLLLVGHLIRTSPFEPVSPSILLAGAAGQAFSRIRACNADFDNDGRIDAVVTTLDGPVKLFHNITAGAGHWLAVRLRGTSSNRQGLGAVVCVTLPDGRALYSHATTSVGYASSSEPLVRFGLGPYTGVKQVEVRLPGGRSQTVIGVTGGRIIEIVEAKR